MVRNDHNRRESKNRKKHFSKANKSRKLKQYLAGVLFFTLLAFGWLYSLIGYFIPLCMIAGIGIASWKGRKWCNWMCPRGSFQIHI
jgi:ferredoxin-type protein NapH